LSLQTVFEVLLTASNQGVSEMYKLLNHMELYYTGILIIVLATSVPWCWNEVIKRRMDSVWNLLSASICRDLLRFSPERSNTSSAISWL